MVKVPGLCGSVLWAAALAWTLPLAGQHHHGPVQKEKAADRANQSEETKRMVALLDKLADRAAPERSPYLNAQRVEKIKEHQKPELALGPKMSLQRQLAVELLRAGESEASIEAFQALARMHVDHNLKLDMQKYRKYLSLAYLRLGEQQNCQLNHTIDSCLLPIRDSGVHRLQEGSRGAVALLLDQLKEYPDDLVSRWLLNIAAMTLGDYPDKVPEQWRIPPKVFESDHALPRFLDVAGPAGVAVDALSGGVVVEDFDNDGYLDIMASSWGLRDQIRYFRNKGDGSFEERTRAAGLTGITGGLNLVHADYDNDGFADVLVLRGAWLRSEGKWPNSLLKNDGKGGFSDVTESAGLLSLHPTQTAVWLDYNNDGNVDLFIGNESDASEAHPCELFHNNGDGSFRDVAARVGLDAVGFVKGVTAGDYDNDGLVDLFLSRMEQTNVLFQNKGPGADGASWSFAETTFAAGVYGPVKSFPTWFWDYDNDGWLDLFVADYGVRDVGDVAADFLGLPHPGEKAVLYRNKGDGTFEDVSAEVGLEKVTVAMGANFGDLDNDGYLDFYLGTGRPELDMLVPNRMFRNDRGRKFQEVTAAGGFGHLQKGHGIAFADLDNDGDQDIYEVMGGAFSGDNYRNALFLNPGNDRHWLALKLEGSAANRGAIGARVAVTIGGDGSVRTLHRTVGSGGSFGASPLRVHIGLGKAREIVGVEIKWPGSSKPQKLTGIAVDRCYKVIQGQAKPQPMPLTAFRFAPNHGY